MTTTMHWSPVTPKFHHHHHHVGDLFPRFFGGTADEAAPPVPSWLPAAEGRLEEGTYIIQFALPGVDPKMVDVRLQNNVLTIRGERQSEQTVEKENYHRMERSFGSFCRAFTLPTSVEPDKIRADFKDGVLSITLPKAESAKAKRIEIAASAA